MDVFQTIVALRLAGKASLAAEIASNLSCTWCGATASGHGTCGHCGGEN